jgi:hypothetical protein
MNQPKEFDKVAMLTSEGVKQGIIVKINGPFANVNWDDETFSLNIPIENLSK